MVEKVILNIVGPILVSIIATIVIAWLKVRRNDKLNFFVYSSEDVRIIDSFIVISAFTMLFAVYIIVYLYINKESSIEIQRIFLLRSIASTVLLNGINLSFHVPYLKNCYEGLES